MINSQRLTDTFLELVRIDSPSLHEKAVADHLCALLAGRGYDIHVDNAGAAIVLALRDACGTLTVTEILSRVAEPESVESDDARAMIEHHLDELARRALVHRAPLDCH